MRGKQFRLLRNVLGHTQAQAASEVGVSQSAISKLENGYFRRLSRTHTEALFDYSVQGCKVLLASFGAGTIHIEFKRQ